MAAKIAGAQLDAMRAAIGPLDTADNRAAYREGRFARADRTRDVDMRYRWDLYHASRVRLDGDLTDAHIDTALRAIVAPLAVT